MTFNLSPQDWLRITEYLDGRLNPNDTAEFEKRIASTDNLKSGLEEMRLLKTVLHKLPRQPVPRNFTLSRSLAASQKQTKSFIPVFRWASAFSGALTVLVFIAGFFFSQGLKMTPMVSAPPLVEKSAADNTNLSTPTQVMIIQWGAPVTAMGKGGGGGNGNEAQTMVLGGGQVTQGLTQGTESGIGGGAPEILTTPQTTEAAPATGELSMPLTTSVPLENPQPAAPSLSLGGAAPAPSTAPAILLPTPGALREEPVTGTGPILGVLATGPANATSTSIAPPAAAPVAEKSAYPFGFAVAGTMLGILTIILIFLLVRLSRNSGQ